MSIPGSDIAIRNLIKWSEREEWVRYRDEILSDHFDMTCERMNISMEEIADQLGYSFGMIMGCAYEDLFTEKFGENGEKNIIDDYLKRRGWNEKVAAKRYLKAMKDTVISLYEVIDLDPGHSMTVKDLILEDQPPVTIIEKLGSESAAKWDRLAGRIVIINKKYYFTGSLMLFDHDVSDRLLGAIIKTKEDLKKKIRAEARLKGLKLDSEDDLMRGVLVMSGPRLFNQIWLTSTLSKMHAPMPEVRNTDGDELVFSETRFPVKGKVGAIIKALEAIPNFEANTPDGKDWSWNGAGSPSQRKASAKGLATEDSGKTLLGSVRVEQKALTLSTNSMERAEQGKALLQQHLCKLVGQSLTSHQTLEKMMEEGRPPIQSQEELPPEFAEKAILQYLDKHYRQTIGEPIPMLDDKTPRQAIRSKKGRAQVESWLKTLENSEARMAKSEGRKPYDFGWMWHELKLRNPE